MRSARLAKLAVLLLLADAGCLGRGISQVPTGGSPAGSSGGSSSSSATSSSGTTAVASSSGATSAGTGTGGGTTGGSTAGTTGTSTGSPYWDGGYVHCSLPFAADGGMDGHGGPATWLCAPGTYFCDMIGNLGNCFQCLSNADCANQAQPTYDPARQRCDLDSGILGYENHCEACLTSADCSGSPAGPFCDLQTNKISGIFDPLEPSFEDIGFETCGPTLEDCRLDGGPSCKDFYTVCDPRNGRCDFDNGSCTTNLDCAGIVSADPSYLLTPVCWDGYCAPCDGGGGGCLYVACDAGADCSGVVPACVNGFCSCDSQDQCSDAGLVCVPPPEGSSMVAFCGLPCTAPSSPACSNLFDDYRQSLYAICNPDTGLCEHCTTDQECQSNADTGGPICLSKGECGCTTDSDCAAGQGCQLSYDHQTCVPRASSCSP